MRSTLSVLSRVSAVWMAMFAWVSLSYVIAVEPPVAPAITDAQLEADWLSQARLRYGGAGSESTDVTTQEDASGGCDGIINGKWGFHTELEQDPWWQVDLGERVPLERLRIYNRCDGGFAGRAARLKVLVSDDGVDFTAAYQHDGSVFLGEPDKKPLVITLPSKPAQFVRIQLPGKVYFHLDEVEVYAAGRDANLARGKVATQSSVSQWSVRHHEPLWSVNWPDVVRQSLARGERLLERLQQRGVAVATWEREFASIREGLGSWEGKQVEENRWRDTYFHVRRVTRQLALTNPLLDFDSVLFVKRAPSMFPHLSDQYYGWWSRPGGGIYLLSGMKSQPNVRCLTSDWPAGNFSRPDLSHDGRRVLFAYSQYDPAIADVRDKRNKDNVPEHVFYHLFELDLETAAVRQLTHGKYDDFDGRYLPDGNIVFLSTRKGQFLQCTEANSRQTLEVDLPDSYVRCGGDDYRPVPVFTLHALGRDGASIRPISAFETFEYTPSVANDGRLLYCRWDYIDRFNGHFFSLWSTNPDGTNAQLVYGNYTRAPQATMEPRGIPGSSKILFTAAAHHSITGGSLVLLDQSLGNEGEEPLTRLTPEVPFPETERNVDSYYANPWPLSEDFYLVSWSDRALPPHGRFEDDRNPVNAQGIYLCDRFGNLDLLHRDAEISSMTPIPLKARPRPPVVSSLVDWQGPQVGSIVVQDVYQGLRGIERGEVKRLRIVGVVPKVQPHMNVPSLGLSREETGKFVLGSVPVEQDGSAYFQIPSGLPVFFQALDDAGMALQTMRSLTYVQPGQRLSCIGCHESRQSTPSGAMLAAMRRGPSRIQPGPVGTWPLRFDVAVQPVLDEKCVECHRADGNDPRAAVTDLSSTRARQTILDYADGDLGKLVFERDASIPGENPARRSRLLQYLQSDPLHQTVPLSDDQVRRLAAWMDTYGHTQGAFSEEQEEDLRALRARYEFLLEQ